LPDWGVADLIRAKTGIPCGRSVYTKYSSAGKTVGGDLFTPAEYGDGLVKGKKSTSRLLTKKGLYPQGTAPVSLLTGHISSRI